MMKKQKAMKAACLALAAGMAFGSLAGCGGGLEFREDTLYVCTINKGYGTEWITALLDGYVAKNEGMKYKLTPSYDESGITREVEAGAGYCNYDLIFSGIPEPADARFLADLSDIYAYEYESGSRQGMTVEQSMEKGLLKSTTQRNNEESNYKTLIWTSTVSGLLLNVTKLNETLGAGWQDTYKLRTTEELIDFCEVLDGKDLSAFVHCADTNQYGGMYNCWFAQYNGVQGVSDYYNGKYVNSIGEEGIGPAVCYNQGVLEALKVGEAIWGAGYSHAKSNGIEWTASQSYFMTGESGMFHNGDWFAREMGTQYPNVELKMIRTPMLSAVGTKLGITEAQLIELIDYVDALNAGETPTKPTVSTNEYTADQLIEKVTEARKWAYTTADHFTAAVVDYNKKDVAKDFLKYMLSDEGQEIYVRASKGLTMPYGYDIKANYSDFNSLPTFAKSRWDIVSNVHYYMVDSSTKYGAAGLSPFAMKSQAPLGVLFSRNSDRKTAQQIYEYDYEYHSEQWNNYEQY